MNIILPDNAVIKLVLNSSRALAYTHVAHCVAKYFRSIHYLSSKLVCGCVLANIALNDKILPHSADKIITCVRREYKSLYTTVDNALISVADKFEEYAKSVLGCEYNNIKALDIRNTNYIIYVLSLDMKRNLDFDKSEIFYSVFTYDEIKEYGLSIYR